MCDCVGGYRLCLVLMLVGMVPSLHPTSFLILVSLLFDDMKLRLQNLTFSVAQIRREGQQKV